MDFIGCGSVCETALVEGAGDGYVARVHILDRYLLRQFFAPLVYCMAAFWMLIVLFDLLGSKLQGFVESDVSLGTVVRYYLLVSPEFLSPTIPLAMLLALLYALSLLAKYQELNAIRASGVSLKRTMWPLMLFGLLASGLVLVINEMVLPTTNARAKAMLGELVQKGKKSDEAVLSIRVDLTRRYWHAKFNRRTMELSDVEVTQEGTESVEPLEKIRAAQARWLDGEWWFFDGVVSDYTQASFGVPRPEVFKELRRSHFTETPKLFAIELDKRDAAEKASHMSARELREYIGFFPGQERSHYLAPYRTRLQERFAQPLTCLLVMLLGIPLGSRSSRRGPLMAAVTALLLLFAFRLTTELVLPLGQTNTIAPWLAAWLPYAVFGAVGSWLMLKME